MLCILYTSCMLSPVDNKSYCIVLYCIVSLLVNIPNMEALGGIHLKILRMKHFSLILIFSLQTNYHVNTEEHGIFTGFTHSMDFKLLE